jgi:hypothetical protein
MPEEPEHLTLAERDAIVMAARTAPDGFLDDLVYYAENGLGLVVGLLVNGMIVVGALTGPEVIAEELVKARHNAYGAIRRSGASPDDEEWSARHETFAAEPRQAVERLYEDQQKLTSELEAHEDQSITKLPRDLARRFLLDSTRPHITLENATINAPGTAGTTRVPALRVAVAHITAWWVAQPDENGNASTTLWGD